MSPMAMTVMTAMAMSGLVLQRYVTEKTTIVTTVLMKIFLTGGTQTPTTMDMETLYLVLKAAILTTAISKTITIVMIQIPTFTLMPKKSVMV